MKWIVYQILFALVFPFLLPGFLLRMFRRGGYAARLGDRFALYPTEIVERFRRDDDLTRPHIAQHRFVSDADAFVWIHAVSVGEVQVAAQLMTAWRGIEPTVRFCFSTTSSTGWKMAGKAVSSRDVLIYNPLDFPNFVKSALRTVKPRAIVLTESEIWPNFIRMARRYGVPTFLINARVSDRSAPRYRLARTFFSDVFSCFSRIFAQSDLDRDRLLAAGAPGNRVEVTGSFKFDVARRCPDKEKELSSWLGVGADGSQRQVLLGGSTWPGEDKVLLGIYDRILKDDSIRDKPLLVIAPRHFEKADAVEENILAAGFGCVRRSRGETVANAAKDRQNVFLADTTGELMGLYGIADAVFVGKSLCAHGSQNMIEPCLCGKPTFVGPFTENFRPVMSDLLAAEAIVQVRDAEGLANGLMAVFGGGSEVDLIDAAALGCRAENAVRRRCGVVPRCIEVIRERIG